MLAVSRIAASSNTSHHLVMLHGIYGRGRNWQAIARNVVAARPDYACWLVDLPHHGDSGPTAYAEGVVGLAADVRDWLVREGVTPDVILGHSYGGKIALAMAAAAPEDVLTIWVIDSTPETKTPSGSAWTMLDLIRSLPSTFATRDELINGLVAGGFTLGVAQWMSTNLIRGEHGFTWRLDFDVMERLLRNFFVTDMWAVIDRPSPRHQIHFLKASESSAISLAAVERIAAADPAHVHLHIREGGHWIHAESPGIVTELVVGTLP